MTTVRTAVAGGATASLPAGLGRIRALWALCKPRINALLLFTAFCAMVMAQKGIPSWRVLVPGLVGLALAGGGSAALNMWYDRDIDAVMSRTRHRPLPQGEVQAATALVLAIAMGVAGVAIEAIWVNGAAALWTTVGYVYYGIVYTMLLKRRTPQNIVIGGGAGAIPPLVGWAAVTGHLAVPAWLLFAVVLLWTPSHFWGLALYKADDYANAGVPMMPVVRGIRSTRRQMLAYATLLWAVTLAITPYTRAPIPYAAGALTMAAGFWWINYRLLRSDLTDTTWARRTFLASLAYLPAAFTWVVLCTLWSGGGLG